MAMMGHDNDTTVKDGPDSRASAGVLIRCARELAELSCEQLAARVNLLTSQIIALENDRYERLPGAMFVRSYLRSIARVLAMDEAGLLAAWQQATASATVASSRPAVAIDTRAMRPISLERATSVRRHWGLIAAALLVAGLWGWQQREHESSRALSLTPSAVDGQGSELPGGIEDALSGNEATRLMDSVELLPIVKPQAGAPNTASLVATSGEQATAAQQLAAGDSQVITATGDQLSMRFSADCWVEIKDRDNRVLVAALKHANEKLQLEGRGPFRVLLGFAPGVEMAYNGTPVNIEVPQGSRSTRLIVGSS
jgi:cytoskeleton protein RodZ